MSELLPCPFCGCDDIEVREGSSFRWVAAECQGCGAQCEEVRKQTIGEGTDEELAEQAKADAIKAWNTRAMTPTPSQIQQVIEHLDSLGYAVVPKEATHEMCKAAHDGPNMAGEHHMTASDRQFWQDCYRAMLSAAPAYAYAMRNAAEKGG